MFAAGAVLASAYLLLSEVRYVEVPDSPLFRASLEASKAELVDSPIVEVPERSAVGPQRPTCAITCFNTCNQTTCGSTNCMGTCRTTCARTCSQPSCEVSCGPVTCDVTCRQTCQSTCMNTCSQITCESTCVLTCAFTCTMQLHAGAFNPRPEEEANENGPEEAEPQ
jgi:hypothetical protein